MQRECTRLGRSETSKLIKGLDFRLPEYRREVFLRFYEFHLENRTHPGCVYFAMPWLRKEWGLDREQSYWMAFLNGNTQNIVTTSIILDEFPYPDSKGLAQWFNENYAKLEWDTDRRYHKKDFLKSVACYVNLTGGNQHDYFKKFTQLASTEEEAFDLLWKALRRDFYTFGRLSSFSYAEYLRIIGLGVDCSTLFLHELDGSKSHRNGLAKVLGRDDLDWHASTTFDGKYQPGEIDWLITEAALLRTEARERFRNSNRVPIRDVGYFTLESALCTYKSWHRPNRRYPNVYADMFYNRIKRAERLVGQIPPITQWWDCRAECLPEHLCLEAVPKDPGLSPEKQNFYRLKGVPIMMSKQWPEFDNSFDRRIWS